MTTRCSTPTCILALGSHTELATALNAAMASDPLARWDYLFTYGESWTDLPTPGAVVEPITALASRITDESAIRGLNSLARA